MAQRYSFIAEWGPPAVAALAVVAVGRHTWRLPVLGPQELTLILCALAWGATAAWVAAGPGRRRMAQRLRSAKASTAWVAAVALSAAVGATAMGLLNPAFALVTAMFVHAWTAAANTRMFPLAVAFVGFLTWALLYGSLALISSVPALARIPRLRPLAATAYSANSRVIQTDPECAVYDPELSYRLRPGECVFENVEFRTHYQINSFGVRDDEESLQAPRVVLVGDSYTMGWGVEEHEAFPALLEQALGKRTLNAGISSYGTVRELLLLEKVDRSALEAVVIQYCVNDDYENRRYLDNGNHLPIQSRQDYEAGVAYQVSTRRFHPLRLPYKIYETQWAELALESLHALGWPPPWTEDKVVLSRPEAARSFLTVLDHSPVDLSGRRVILFDLGWGVGEQSPFLPEVAQLLGALPADDWRSRIEVVDVLPALGVDDMLPIDRHLNAQGQRKVAEMLLAALRRPPPAD